MSSGIRFRQLVLRGLNRDYGPSFLQNERAAGLAIIAGEIATGKTTILEFLDYCLGSSQHPQHPELIEVSIRTALLEVEIDSERCVIERSAFPAAPIATVHWVPLDDLGEEHAKEARPIRPPGAPDSLSSLLLGATGLSGVRLKEAPTQVASGLDPLSFRDVLGVCYIDNDRLGSKRLLFEGDRMKNLKLTQVIDVIFGVHEDAMAEMSGSIAASETRRDQLSRDIATLTTFLEQRQIADPEALAVRLDRNEEERQQVANGLSSIDMDLRSQTSTADDLRGEYDVAVAKRAHSDTVLRDRETLLARLRVLRGQYAADIARLTFSAEAERLFDDLSVTVCPVCRSALEPRPSIEEGRCSLCGSIIDLAVSSGIDVGKELGSTRSRLDELNAYLASVSQEIERARTDVESAVGVESVARERLDTATASTLAPFLSQRDALLARQRELAGERAALDQARQIRAGLADRQRDLDRLTRELDDLRTRYAALNEHRRTRDDIVSELSDRFRALLGTFNLHKLDEAHLDSRYAPYVRNRPYQDLSSGTRTLVSIAWALAILEIAIEGGHSHPGFLVIDGLQKNLTPAEDGGDPELDSPDIVDHVYRHLLDWAAGRGRESQILVVDNRPPHRADGAVVVRYSSDPEVPPYGLIEDAIR